MRTLVDLGNTQIQALDELSKKDKRSRAALIRLAIDEISPSDIANRKVMRSAYGVTQSGRLGLSGKGAKRVVKALFDTNILIDYLNAVPEARTELQRYAEKAVSIITWMEVMVGANHDLEAGTRSFLSGFDIVAVDE